MSMVKPLETNHSIIVAYATANIAYDMNSVAGFSNSLPTIVAIVNSSYRRLSLEVIFCVTNADMTKRARC